MAGLGGGPEAGCERAAIVRGLAARGFDGVRFHPQWEVFSLELDPALHSFADVRRAVVAVGVERGRRYLAVIMSP